VIWFMTIVSIVGVIILILIGIKRHKSEEIVYGLCGLVWILPMLIYMVSKKRATRKGE